MLDWQINVRLAKPKSLTIQSISKDVEKPALFFIAKLPDPCGGNFGNV